MSVGTARALLVAMDADSAGALRERCGAQDVTLEQVPSADDALARFESSPGAFDALVIGPLERQPFPLAQRVARLDRDVSVLVLAAPEQLESLRATFRYTPFIGQRTSLHGADGVAKLAGELQRAVQETRLRREHQRTLQAVSSRLLTVEPVRPRPSAVLDRLLELVLLGILELDVEGHARVSNPAARRILGQSEERLSRASLALLLPPGFEALLEKVRATGAPAQALLEAEGPRGPRFLEASLAPLPEDATGLGGFLLVLQDTTEQVRLQREREGLLQQLEAAVRMRDEFLSVTSHELRTPLTSMLGWVQMLRNGTLSPEKQSRALEIIERNAKSQAQLIEDLLDVSRIISGKLRLEVASLQLEDVVRAAVESVTPAAQAKDIRLQVVLDDTLGPVMGDAHRLQQVAWNLLTNAVKFTPKGGRVHVTLRRVSSSAELTVRDTGQGIAPEFLPHVFERFRQADSSATRRHGGLGLGLSIVRHLVELHGGRVSVSSEGLGQGATFVVSLPISPLRLKDPSADPATAGAPTFDCPEGIAGLRVLLVEDEPDVREMLVTLLERCGLHVTAASSAAEAWELLPRGKPDVLISDVGMPGEDGYTFLRRVRALPVERGGRIPALAITAHARPEDRRKALLAGFQMHLAKPVPADELLLMIATLAGRL
ncbi:hybrid sensor histidine kinase/response regulator [Cystobacter ferrugineus]|nr:ATP-binding protein [Cystobacter ferrugineus]